MSPGILERVPSRVLCVAVFVVLLAAPPALADGGRTIATAPRAAWDVHYTGTTVDPAAPCPTRLGSYFSYWTLRVTKGDRVIVDWGAQQKGTVVSLLPAGTTDAKGNVQPEHAPWNPSGYLWNGWHAVSWEVT